MVENPVAEQRLRTMCMNWCFLQDHTFLSKLDLNGYKKMRFDLYKKLISHPQYETLVKPAFEEFKTCKSVLAAMNSTPFTPDSTILLIALPPPPPIRAEAEPAQRRP